MRHLKITVRDGFRFVTCHIPKAPPRDFLRAIRQDVSELPPGEYFAAIIPGSGVERIAEKNGFTFRVRHAGHLIYSKNVHPSS